MALRNELFTKLLYFVERGIPAVLFTLVDIGDNSGLIQGSRLLAIMGEGHYGSLGLPELDEKAIARAEKIFYQAVPSTGLFEINLSKQKEHSLKVLADSYFPQKKIIILGGGHVAQPLVEMAYLLGFKTIVVDDRPEFANPERFPKATDIICTDYQKGMPLDEIDSSTCIVIITRGHQYDQLCLSSVLNSSAFYIGMIGSSGKVRQIFRQLQSQGVDKRILQRISAPIGLDLGGQKPAEIALSIMAEIVAKLNSGTCRPLKEVKAGIMS